MKMFDLTGQVAVVTGASSGIGSDAALAYAEAGANVALLARRKEKLEKVAQEVEQFGVKALVVPCDVSVEDDVRQAIETVVKEFGRIDILLNNAGVAVGGTVETLSEENWDRINNINVKGPFLLCKYVIPVMKERQYGRVVNIASVNAVIADKLPTFQRHAYNTTKAAVLGLNLGMACTYAQDGINVNAIGPGLFETEMTENSLFKSEQFLNAYNFQNPTGRPGKKGELNGTILYLSSPACSYVTGQFIVADGGGTLV